MFMSEQVFFIFLHIFEIQLKRLGYRNNKLQVGCIITWKTLLIFLSTESRILQFFTGMFYSVGCIKQVIITDFKLNHWYRYYIFLVTSRFKWTWNDYIDIISEWCHSSKTDRTLKIAQMFFSFTVSIYRTVLALKAKPHVTNHSILVSWLDFP